MIPRMNIIAWGNVVPWVESRQVEQDLVISRALVEIFSDPLLREALRFRGGTALNKLHFPAPLRYSEDIDLVRTTAGPIGPILDQLRAVLQPWLGQAAFEQSAVAPKLRFRAPAEDAAGNVEMRLKIEIGTREITAYDAPLTIPFRVDNPWFSGTADIRTFSREEMLSTKLRALLQRNKGRDLFDLAHALDVFEGLNRARVIECFRSYLEQSQISISRAQAEQRMFQKLGNPAFLTDMRPLLAADEAQRLTDTSAKTAFSKVFFGFVTRIPGDPWAETNDMIEKHGIADQTRA